MKKITLVLTLASILFLLTGILATWLYLHSQVDYQAHHRKIERIRHIQAQVASLTRHLLLVEKRQISHYDQVTQTQKSISRLIANIPIEDKFVSDLSVVWIVHNEHVEKIKSLYAVYRNSLIYFPKGTELLYSALVNDEKQKEFIKELVDLQHQVLFFSSVHDESHGKQLLTQIEKFNDLSKTLPEQHIFTAQMLSKHAQILLSNYQLLHNLYKQLLASPITRQAQMQLDYYNAIFQQQIDQANNIRRGFYLVSLVLMLIVVISLVKLKSILAELQLTARVFEHSPEGIVISNSNNEIIKVNQSFMDLTGYKQHEVLGKNPNILSSGKQNQQFYEHMWQEIREYGLWQGELYNRRKNGEIYPEWLSIIAVSNENKKKVSHYIAIFNDLTEKKKAEQNIHFLAHYDTLTGLPNRTLFQERVEHAMDQVNQANNCIAVLFLGLDRFKPINDSLGRDAGDALLILVAEDLKHCLRDIDTVARIGGDEFSILLEGINKEAIYKTCPIIAENILQRLSCEYSIKDTPVYIGVSIGIAVYPGDAKNLETLMQRADLAMYHAKDEGRNNFQFYSEKLNVMVQKRLRLEADLRAAIEQQQFFLNYQPQYNLTTLELDGFEALIRWQHPQMGLVVPDEFISIAEESGLILEMGEWVLTTACCQLVEWRNKSKRPLRMAINVSVKQLEKESFVSVVKSVLEKTGLAAEYLELEVTENIFLDEDSTTLQTMHQLDQLGVQISMDDFGTGYSNMSYLKKLPLDRIKIDRCFVSDLPHDENNAAIVCAIIDISRHFGIKVIAEGIEYQEQALYLVSRGCDEGQGYFFDKPLSVEAADILLESQAN